MQTHVTTKAAEMREVSAVRQAAAEMRARAWKSPRTVPRHRLQDPISVTELMAWDIAKAYNSTDTDRIFRAKMIAAGWTDSQLTKHLAAAQKRAIECLVQEQQQIVRR